MKINKRIKLLRSQKILLQTKRDELMVLMKTKQDEFSEILDVVMIEQGVPEKQTRFWYLATDGQAIEKINPKKPREEQGKK